MLLVYIRLVKLYWRRLGAHAQVDHLDEHREAHREVDVALRNVEAQPVADERHANHQQEGERQHFHRRVFPDEQADGAGQEHHDADGDDDGGDHDGDIVCHADGGDDRVEREDDIEEHDIDDDRAERRRDPARAMALFAFELFVDLDGGFVEQEEAAADQDEVAAGDVAAEHGEQRLGEAHDPGDGEQQQDAHAHGGEQPGAPRLALLVCGQLAR